MNFRPFGLPLKELFSGHYSRIEISALLNSRIEVGRAWVQRNGELAAVGGFVVGVVVITFFWLFLSLLVLASLLGGIAWLMARE